jgi:hypothetical protein
MFVARNTVDELERGRRLTAVTNNLAALVGLLVLGFPIKPSIDPNDGSRIGSRRRCNTGISYKADRTAITRHEPGT